MTISTVVLLKAAAVISAIFLGVVTSWPVHDLIEHIRARENSESETVRRFEGDQALKLTVIAVFAVVGMAAFTFGTLVLIFSPLWCNPPGLWTRGIFYEVILENFEK